MDMNQATLWWIVCGALIAVELASGTFYLLMLALGAAAAALTAHLGPGGTVQMVVAALVGGTAVSLWHLRQLKQRAAQPPASANPDVNIDIGQSVHVGHWGTERTAKVKYRGAEWQVRYAGDGQPAAGRHVIRGVEGSCLLVDAAEPQH